MAASRDPIIVTGAASGVGDATAQMLIDRGHTVISIDIQEPSAPVAEHNMCDLSDPASIAEVCGRLTGRYASLLNIAGVPGSVGDEKTIAVNLLGLRELTRHLFDRIADGGTIVNVASIAGNNWKKRRDILRDLLATDSFADGIAWWRQHGAGIDTDAYTFSKEGVVLYTMQLAMQGIARGIRVNDVGPGLIETPILPDFLHAMGQETSRGMLEVVGRAAQPHEIAEAVVVLAEGEMTWLNGQHIIVDGGMMAGLWSGARRPHE